MYSTQTSDININSLDDDGVEVLRFFLRSGSVFAVESGRFSIAYRKPQKLVPHITFYPAYLLGSLKRGTGRRHLLV